MTRVLCRMEVFSYYRSRATEISTANWGWTLVGITAEKLKTALDNFQRSMVSLAPVTHPAQLRASDAC